jgi:hypothetical protein
MTSTLIVMLPLLPGKQEAWRQFCQALQGSRHHEYDSCLHRMGITRQAVWLSQSMRGDVVHLYLHVEQCERIVTALAASAHPFDRWLRRSLLELHGLDLSQLARSDPELILVWPPAHIEAAVPDEEKQHETTEEIHEY